MADDKASKANITEIENAIRVTIEEVKKITGDREALNDDMQAVLSALEADHGINREAVRLAVKVMGWDQDKRQVFDIAYGLVRTVAGQPLQAELFEPGTALNFLAGLKDAQVPEGDGKTEGD